MSIAPPAVTVDQIIDIAAAAPGLTTDQITETLHSSSPRVRFLKSCRPGSKVLDLGAGEGSMQVFRNWLSPARPDIEMYAVSLEKGPHFDAYAGYELGNFNTQKPDFGGMRFDGLIACHFVEHIEGGVDAMVAWAKTRMAPGGRLYIEFPSEFSKTAPSRSEYAERSLDVSCANFFDDYTHVETVGLEATRQAIEAHGLFIEESGFWRNPFIEDVLLQRGAADNHQYLSTVGVWMKTYFCQYAIAVMV